MLKVHPNLLGMILQVVATSRERQMISKFTNKITGHFSPNLKVNRLFVFVGMVDTFVELFIEVTAICMNTDENADMKAPMNMLLMLLDILHNVLKYVSDVVRKALQVIRGWVLLQ